MTCKIYGYYIIIQDDDYKKPNNPSIIFKLHLNKKERDTELKNDIIEIYIDNNSLENDEDEIELYNDKIINYKQLKTYTLKKLISLLKKEPSGFVENKYILEIFKKEIK